METEFNIGKIIIDKLKEDERSISWLARKVHCDPTNFGRVLKKGKINTHLLFNISLVMNFDFFVIYSKFYQDYKEQCYES